MECYTRAGVFAGWKYDRPVVCLANIRIREELRGGGLFSSIIRTLKDEADLFGLHRIEIERVENPRLADWLTRNHFSIYSWRSLGTPSTTYFLDVVKS
ncbi:hypothetical protein [Paraburkholderia hospita]|uniref:hypothetical protein n=1 Tax=Paraburkholderia hospita TaxID=169430 RepID=UPI003ED0F050